ncbi:MAG: protein kinase, partial [Planctomycetota bacterium]
DEDEDDEDDEDDDDEEEGEDLRAARTFLDLSESSEGEDVRAARTFMDLGGGDEEDEEEDDEEEEGDDFRAARTFMDLGGGGGGGDEEAQEGGDFRAARTFMDLGGGGDEAAEQGDDFRAARTFLDLSESGESDRATELRSARTFMDMGGGDEEEDDDEEEVGPRTFMDLETAPGYASSETRRSFLEEQGDDVQTNTFMDIGVGPVGEETTGTSLGNQSAYRKKDDQTFMDVQAGALGSGTDVGAQSGTRSRADTEAGISGAGGSSSTISKGGATGGSTEADLGDKSGQKKKKKKKKAKKEEEDAYSHPLVGKVIGGCRIVKKLGEGGMGAVFLAEHTRLKRQSVIKVIPAHLSSNRQLIARFQREAQAAAVIQHPNVVNVFNVGDENGVHFIEMEFVDGVGLDARMKENAIIPQMEAVRIIKEACKGLGEAHKHGIVHRDIKPDNIMLTRKGQVKIADFGLARASSGDAELTKVGQILGTPAYMSPEQCQGKPTDSRCDIYSLGATFYAMVTGKRPFTGKSVMEIMQKHIDEQPISPREYNPELSVAVAKVILHMMAKKPEERYQHAEEIVDALDKFLKEEGTEHLVQVQKALGARYRLIKKLGQGGMGAVYSAKAEEPVEGIKPGETVAVKVLTQDVSQEDVERFRLEAELALAVDHPGIIKVIEFKISKEINYIVMEYVEGESVRDMLNHGAMAEPEVLRVLKASCMALGAAHDKGIVHRDIKPDNLMIAKDGRIKIADFGVAKQQDGHSELTQAGFLVGTPHYMSPEQCSGESGVEVTVRADIYSLGATAYYMATGQKPFEGDTQPTILLQHMKTPAKPPKEVKEDLSEGLSNVILNMMAKRPEYRYASLSDVLEELIKVEKGQVPKKRKKIDVPFGESEAKGTFFWLGVLGAAALLFMVAAFGISQYREIQREQLARQDQEAKEKEKADRQDKLKETRQQLGQAYDAGAAEVRGLMRKRQLGAASQRVDTLEGQLKTSDYVYQDPLGEEASQSAFAVDGYTEKCVGLRGDIEREGKARDADVAKAQKAIADARAQQLAPELERFDGQLKEQKAAAREFNEQAEDGRRSLLRERLPTGLTASRVTNPLNLSADPCSIARSVLRQVFELQKDPQARFGDTPIRQAWCDAQRNEVLALVNARGKALLRQVNGELKETRLVDRWGYYGRAKQLFASAQRLFPETVRVDDEKGWEVALEAGKELKSRLGELDGPSENNELFAAETMLSEALADAVRTKAPYLPYERLIKTYRKLPESGRKTDVLTVLEQGRTEAVSTLRQSLSRSAEALVEPKEGEKAQLKTALERIDEKRRQLDELVGAGDPEARKSAEEQLDQARSDVEEKIYKRWKAIEKEILDLAWQQRRFLAAEVRCLEIQRDPEMSVALPELFAKKIKDGQEPADSRLPPGATFQERVDQLHKDMRMNLDLLRSPETVVMVPGGEFPVGDDAGYPNERPRHEVRIQRLVFDAAEVTIAEYKAFLSSQDGTLQNGFEPGWACRRHLGVGSICLSGEQSALHPEFGHAPPDLVEYELEERDGQRLPVYVKDKEGKEVLDESGQRIRKLRFKLGIDESKPITNITWYDACAYARWAGKRLPTESEWEVAASCVVEAGKFTGEKRPFPWGNQFDTSRLVCSASHDSWTKDTLQAVRSKPDGRSALGLYDMAGSVWEWTSSNYDAYDKGQRREDPDFGTRFRVIRGGSFEQAPYHEPAFRTSYRGRALPTDRQQTIGFRCVRDAEPGE